MDAFEARLAIAEFEELWTEVEYHEGRAGVADVERAIAQVDGLRRAIAGRRGHQLGAFPLPGDRPAAPLGH
jgi:hypothetical protein